MALYLGNSDQQNIILNGCTYCLNVFSNTNIINNNVLLSFDNYILMDSNGLSLTVKEEVL